MADKKIVEMTTELTTKTATLTASFAGTAIVMLTRQLEKSGALQPGVLEKSIRDFLSTAPTNDPDRLDLAFLGQMLKDFGRNKDWPGGGPEPKPYTLH